MSRNNTSLLLFVWMIISSNQFTFAQALPDFEFKYDVNRIHESLSLSKEQINDASTIADLNQYYKTAWVKEYISTEIKGVVKGKEKIEKGHTEILTKEQKNLLVSADANTKISVNINYIPENNLVNNEEKNFEFSFKIYPEKEAHFSIDQNDLYEYLNDKAFQHLNKEDFKIYQLTVLTFAVTEEGKVIDVEVMTSSDNVEIDSLLTEALCQMPDWIPAEYSNGLKVKQEFALTAGDHTSCTINLINIRDKYPLK